MSTAYQIFTQPSQQALDTAASVLSGATLTFTLTGTSTATNAYSDSALTIPLANPLSANSAGVWVPIFLDPTVSYRIVLKTSGGAVLQTWDPANENLYSQDILGRTLYPRTSSEISAGVTPVNYIYPPYTLDRYFTNTTPGTTNATTAFTSMISATPTGSKATIGAGPYLIDANTVIFNKKMDTEWQDTVIYCPATAGQVALQWGLANSGWFNTLHRGRLELYRSSAGGTYLPNNSGSQTAASQLVGTGIKFLNLNRANFELSTYVAGFKYGHYFEADGGFSMSLSRFAFLESQDCLIHMYFRPVDTGAPGTSFITRLSFYDFMSTFNTAHYSDGPRNPGTRVIETDKNNRAMDGLTFFAGVAQGQPERKIKHAATECTFGDVYLDTPNGGTDIELTSTSSMNVFRDNTGQRNQIISDAGTLNTYPHPFYRQMQVLAGYATDLYTYNGSNEIPLRVLPIGTTLSDDGTYDLPTAASGLVAVACGNEGGLWHVASDGTCTKLAGTTNTAANGNDTFLSVFDVGTNARVINRLGSSLKAVIWFQHWV